MSLLSIFRAAILAVVLMLSQQSFAFADAKNSNVPEYIRIPVFFVTDRNRQKTRNEKDIVFGNERKYLGVCLHELYVGVAWCRIKNTEGKPFAGCMDKIGWQETKARDEGQDGIELTDAPTYKEREDKFFKQVHDRAAQTPDHDLYEFLPGYMSTFDSGLRSAARISYYAERPVLLYSWPSKGKFTEYFSDEATTEWTQDHFAEVTSRIAAMANADPPIGLRLYAHSMGCRMVLRSTPILKAMTNLKEVSVVCPDVDDGVVKHYASRYFTQNGTIMVRLYISSRDDMLKLSKLVHGGYKQLGEDKQPLDKLLPAGSQLFVSNEEAAADSKDAPEALHRRMLTVDFSAIDIGTVGHRIPVELLTGLSQTGKPYGKLSLCIVTPKGEMISDNCSADDTRDGVLKVIKPGWKGTPIMGTILRYRPRLRLLRTKDWTLK